MYKAIFIKTLENTKLNWDMVDKDKLLKTIGYKNWVVYAKAPFGGPAQVIEYLGRYTHKIAITHHRILEVTETKVRFKYKDYADGNKAKTMWLTRQEFVRRFELHILPQRFVKIRHRGFLRSRDKMKRLALIREDLKLQVLPPKVKIPLEVRMLEKYGVDITICTECGCGRLEFVMDSRPQRTSKVRLGSQTPPS